MYRNRKSTDQLVPHPSLEGFYQIPRYPLLYINEEQRIVDSRTGTELMPYVGYYDYLKVDVSGLESGILVHRAMAETFIDTEGQDPRKFQVNHRDGVKLHNQISNLEFTTRAGNIIHAFKVGLRTDNRAVLCKDLRTGTVVRYYSMNECSRKIASNQGYLSNYLKGPRTKPVMGVYEVIFEGDCWKGFPEELIQKEPKRAINLIVIYSKEKKEAREYLGRSEAATFLKVSVRAVQKALDEKTLIDTYRVYYRDDFSREVVDPIINRIGRSKTMRGRKPPKPIIVENLETGEVTRWISTERFSRQFNIDKKTIQKSLSVNNGRWLNFKITYCTDGVDSQAGKKQNPPYPGEDMT